MAPRRPAAAAGSHGSKLESVVELVRNFIARKKLRPGDRLPGERELAETLGATRGDIRRGIGYLAALGFLDVRHGVGAFLSSTGDLEKPLAAPSAARGPFETRHMFEARQALETTLAALAAQRCGEEQRHSMEQALDAMATALASPGEFLIHDIRFHRAIAAASGSPVLAALMEEIAGSLYQERRRLAGTARNRAGALQMHRTIFHAIASGDAEGARAAMARHLHVAETAKKTPKAKASRAR